VGVKHERRYRVRFEAAGRIGIATVDHPPVHALGPGVSDGIAVAVDYGEADSSVTAMVLMGAGRSFIAGANIRRFGNHASSCR
jgi:3-hydroxyacyl-CoA dehydrogenase